MNKTIKILALLGVLVMLSGCYGYDYSSQNNDRLQTILRCAGESGMRFDGENCVPIENQTGCITFKGLEIYQVPNLPIGYENLTDHYEDEYLRIRIFCTGWLLKPYNLTCEDWEENTEAEKSEVAYYRIEGNYKLKKENKTIELCWGDLQ